MKSVTDIPQAVSLQDLKRSIHIMPDDSEDDLLFTGYLTAAQEVVETATRRLISPRSVKFELRAVGCLRWWFPVCPVTDVTSLRWQQANGVWADLDFTAVRLESQDDEPQLVFPDGFWATVTDGAAVEVVADAGYSEMTMPRPLKQAAMLLVKDWYEAGIAVEKKEFLDVSFGCRAIMKQYRYARPREYGAA